jgi:hypothetical protein
MTFETLTDIFAVIGVGACVWWAVVFLLRLRGRAERPAAAGEQAAAGEGVSAPLVGAGQGGGSHGPLSLAVGKTQPIDVRRDPPPQSSPTRGEEARVADGCSDSAQRSVHAVAPAAAEKAGGVPAEHVVAIAAAVAASGYRVVHIADPASGSAWVSEGRWIHQTSHRTH